MLEQRARARQGTDAVGPARVRLPVEHPEPVGLLRRHRAAGLAQQRVREEAAAHPDLAMDPPDGELEAHLIQRVLPREHVLVHAIDERPVEIEQECRPSDHVFLHPALRRDAATTGVS